MSSSIFLSSSGVTLELFTPNELADGTTDFLTYLVHVLRRTCQTLWSEESRNKLL